VAMMVGGRECGLRKDGGCKRERKQGQEWQPCLLVFASLIRCINSALCGAATKSHIRYSLLRAGPGARGSVYGFRLCRTRRSDTANAGIFSDTSMPTIEVMPGAQRQVNFSRETERNIQRKRTSRAQLSARD